MANYELRYGSGLFKDATYLLQMLSLAGSVALVLVIIWVLIVALIQTAILIVPGFSLSFTEENGMFRKFKDLFITPKIEQALRDDAPLIRTIFMHIILKTFIVVVACIIVRKLLFLQW